MSAAIDFDISTVTDDFDPIPEGDYQVALTESEIKESQAGGEYIKFRFVVLSGPYQNRSIWENVNLWHSNPQVVKISQSKIARLAKACHLTTVKNTNQLHNIPLVATVKLKARKDNGEMQNVIQRYSAYDPKNPPAQTAAPTATVQGVTQNPPPGQTSWQRRS